MLGVRPATVAFAIVVGLACAAYAEAQTRRPSARPRRPAGGPVDAGAASSADTSPDAGAVPAATADESRAPDAGDAAAAPALPTWIDGGARMSPLNPLSSELPLPASSAAPAAPGPGPDYDRLLGDIAALRARVAVVSDVLLQSRLAVVVRTEGSHAKVTRFVVGLDDGAVYTAPPGFKAEDLVTVYEHAVAPGKHAVTVDVERRDDRDDAVRTSQRSRFVVDVPRDQRVELELRVIDDSQAGDYDLRVRARAVARPVKR